MQLSEKIHLVEHSYENKLDENNILPQTIYSLIIFGEKINLIDCGIKTSHETLFNAILKEKRAINAVQTLILSNSRPNHMGSAQAIKEATGCKVMAHKKELNWIENIHSQYKARPFPGFYDLVEKSVLVDEFIENNIDFRVERGFALKFYHTPGYSKGSVSVYFPQEKVLFASSLFLTENSIPDYENYFDLKKSLNYLKNLPEVEKIVSSHAKPALSSEQISKLYLKTEAYLNQIDAAVKKHYPSQTESNLEHCKAVVKELGMPSFFAQPTVHQAFLSHLKL